MSSESIKAINYKLKLLKRERKYNFEKTIVHVRSVCNTVASGTTVTFVINSL